jgi:CubicO group peptidase (beta-lactamase class C family)
MAASDAAASADPHGRGPTDGAPLPHAHERLFGESFRLGQRLPTLAEYYRGGLRLAVEPGTTFTYTDHGFATLGQIVEDVSGMPLDRYLREHIFEPLGMAHTDVVRSERVESHLATG